MVTTPSPLCLDKELRPQERILAHADKASGCFPNLCPWLKSFLASHSPSIPSLPSFSPSSFFPFFLSFSLPFFSASPVACRSCRARVLALSKANSGVHCWAVFSAPVPRSVGGPQLSPKTGREATPRRSSCAPDFEALGAEGGQGGAFFGAGPSRKPAVNSRTAAPHPRHPHLRQVQKGRAGLACGGVLPAPSQHRSPSSAPPRPASSWGTMATGHGLLCPAKSTAKATCHGGGEARSLRPEGFGFLFSVPAHLKTL